MKRIFSIVLFGCTLLFSGCGNSEEDSSAENSEQVHENLTKSNFEMFTPDDWETVDEKKYPKNIILLKREPKLSSDFSTLISVSSENLSYDSLLRFTQENLENIRKNSQDFQILEQESVELSSGINAYLVEYSDWYSRGNKRIHFYDLYVIDQENNTSYSVQIIHDPKLTEDHKTFLKEKILKSFTLPSTTNEE